MKIAYVGKFGKVWDEEGIARGLEAAGASVFRIEENTPHDKMCALVSEFEPDVVLGAKFYVEHPGHFRKFLRDKGIPSVSWSFDLLIGHPPREARIRTFDFLYSDLVLLTDGGHENEYKELGINKDTLRQGIPDEFCYILAEKQEAPDIVFVGTENSTFPYRQRVMNLLKNKYKERFTWVGRGNSESCRGHDLNALYNSAKIVIGDCMYAPSYWSNRVYETLGRGGFLIHPMIKGLDKEYEPYKEFIPYKWGDFKGLTEKIDYFLDHEEERDKIRYAGFQRTKKEHKMSDRCKRLLDLIKKHT